MTLGKILRCIRIANDYSQREVSKAIGMSTSYVGELENDKKNPSLKVLEKLSKFYKLPKSEICRFEEYSNSIEGDDLYIYQRTLIEILETMEKYEAKCVN